jgi:hypothetical protein
MYLRRRAMREFSKLVTVDLTNVVIPAKHVLALSKERESSPRVDNDNEGCMPKNANLC